MQQSVNQPMNHLSHPVSNQMSSQMPNQMPMPSGISQAAQATEFYPGLPFQLPRGGTDQLPSLAEWNARYIEYVLSFTKGKKPPRLEFLELIGARFIDAKKRSRPRCRAVRALAVIYRTLMKCSEPVIRLLRIRDEPSSPAFAGLGDRNSIKFD